MTNGLHILGIDFTSVPKKSKPITVAHCELVDNVLIFNQLQLVEDFGEFETLLAQDGPWVAGLDFPFGQARRFVENIGWSLDWASYVDDVGKLERHEFREVLESYKAPRDEGDKEHLRATEKGTGGASPQKLYGVPVALMFYEGAPRLAQSGCHIPGLKDGNRGRVCVEAYPGLAARALIGKRSYKAEARGKQTEEMATARRDILSALCGEQGNSLYGLRVQADPDLCKDPKGDALDALLCAAQAAWAASNGLTDAGPAGGDPVEGWMSDPGANTGRTRGKPVATTPADAEARRAINPVICYPSETLPAPNLALYHTARQGAVKVSEVLVPAREAACFHVPAGSFFRISCVDGPQVGDLNLWNAKDLSERFYSGKTRALHGTHLTTGERMWSSFPHLRPMATIVADTLGWYGIDAFGGSVHDVIGTRCDPYTHNLLSGGDYHHCCHSNLTRALAAETGLPLDQAEAHVHDVLNVFMCTGFTRDTGQYFMKASPVRAGDYLEFFAEIDLLGALSACPGGDCSAEHSSDAAACYPLLVEVFQPADGALDTWCSPARNGYCGGHGV